MVNGSNKEVDCCFRTGIKCGKCFCLALLDLSKDFMVVKCILKKYKETFFFFHQIASPAFKHKNVENFQNAKNVSISQCLPFAKAMTFKVQ